MDGFSRRDVFKVVGGAGMAVAVPAAAEAQPRPATTSQPEAVPAVADRARGTVYLFFNSEEAEFVRAAVDRLIPADDQWPGASDAGVVDYIDRQLAGAWGAGSRLYLEGPWQEGTPEQGYQLPFTPAELYRNAILGLREHLERQFGGRAFHQLSPDEQDGLLRDIEKGAVRLGDVPGPVFFETLLANTIEGFFADPAYGGNRDMVAWRMIGFPGAYAAYINLVEHHGVELDRPPIGMAQSALDDHDHQLAHHR